MSSHPRSVDQAIARFDEVMGRIDRSSASRTAERRVRSRGVAALGRKMGNIGIAIGLLIVATNAFRVIVGPIGLGGLFLVASLMVLSILLLSFWPGERPIVEYKEDMPNQAVVQRLEGLLVRKRAALPAPASIRLAQDARRLMGKHLPELIERYERVPNAYRNERDGDGLTVDQRLVAGLDAAKSALDDLGRKLAREDLSAFESQGRFIENRYREDDPAIRGE